MKFLCKGYAATLQDRIKTALAAARRSAGADASLAAVAAEVYLGDVYALRDEVRPVKDSGWGKRCYVCVGRRPEM